MNAYDFAHQEFSADKWESLVKDYISNLECYENEIWYKKGEDNKKISEELIPLGYYVKYKYGPNSEISFRLNPEQKKIDGWICKNMARLESVQIVIAYYDREESEEDRKLMKGEDVFTGGFVGERMWFLEERVEKRIKKKIGMEYEQVDILLVGMKDWFARRANDEYKDLQLGLVDFVHSVKENSPFREIYIVDTDLVGPGALLQIL